MRLTVLAAAAVLAMASPSLAQDAGAAPTAPPAAPQAPLSPEDQAFQTRATAFDGRMQTMSAEISAAVQAAGTDAAQADAAAVGVLANYEADITAFASELEAFLDTKIASAGSDQERTELTQVRANAPQAVRAIPQQIRGAVQQAVARAAAAPVAPPAE
jgi:hypothetical protein